jgi:hypothetical protein
LSIVLDNYLLKLMKGQRGIKPMRFLILLCCVALVAPAFAQDALQAEAPLPATEAITEEPMAELLPTRVGRVSLVSGNVGQRSSAESGWADAELNQPVFAGEALRTDAGARSEIQIGANIISLSRASEVEITNLRDQFTQIALSRGRIGLHLRQAGESETVEIDIPQGGIWLLGPGSYDVDVGGSDQLPRIAVFEGAAHLVAAGSDAPIAKGDMAVLTGSDNAVVTIEQAVPDGFVQWWRRRDYDETRLAASHYISPHMTGFAEVDNAGIWKINAEFGPVWFPIAPEEWAPYRFGHWRWMTPWGWNWIDDQPWGFAPSHYGRWALIDEHWAWVPGGFVARPLYMPAAAAFLGTPGVGLSSEEGAAVGWFPLAPGEAYWPSYARDADYVRGLNRGNVRDTETIRLQADGVPPFEIFDEDFANRQFATVVPRPVFTNGRAVAPARVTLPEQRLRNAPVLMGSPQIAPASAQRIARAAATTVNSPPSRVAVRISRKDSGKPVRAASAQHGQAVPVIIRGAHLHAPSYAGPSRGRQAIVLRVAHSHGSPGKKG